jgi:predicted transcriptional regulator
MQKHIKTSRISHVSRQEQKRVQRFLIACNVIDKHLKGLIRSDGTFGNVVKECWSRSLITTENYDTLKTVASLRNAIVHDRASSGDYPMVPTAPFVEEVERLRDRIRHPLLVIPTFRRKVEVVTLKESLCTILKTIQQRDYSQFPVYDGRRFKGLLTENGITRWLAHHVSNEISLIELDEVTVRMALREEENARSNSHFVSHVTTVGEVKGLFNKRELLEAVLITSTGSPKEELLGIATRWDIVQLH